jgi:hypothetical protein
MHVLCGLGLLCHTTAWAGLVDSRGLTMYFDPPAASGPLRGIRQSPNNQEYLSCRVGAYTGGSWLECAARNTSNQQLTCTLYDTDPNFEAFKAVVEQITPDSYVYFSVDRHTFKCVEIQFGRGSLYLP